MITKVITTPYKLRNKRDYLPKQSGQVITTSSSGTGSSSFGGYLSSLYDVKITNVENLQILMYDEESTNWVNRNIAVALTDYPRKDENARITGRWYFENTIDVVRIVLRNTNEQIYGAFEWVEDVRSFLIHTDYENYTDANIIIQPGSGVYDQHTGWANRTVFKAGGNVEFRGNLEFVNAPAFVYDGHTFLSVDNESNFLAGRDVEAEGSANVIIGADSGVEAGNGYNTIIGAHSTPTYAARSVYIGSFAGNNASGQTSIGIGYEAGVSSSADYSLYIGYQAGKKDTEDNHFLVEHREVSTIPLIEGYFNSGILRMQEISILRSIHSENYVSGILGTGTKWDMNTGGGLSFFEVDNMRVRNELRVHIFKKDIVKAANGYLFITDAAEVAEETYIVNTNSRFRIVDDGTNALFSPGDLVWAKDISEDGSLQVTGVKFTVGAQVDSGTSENGKNWVEYAVQAVENPGTLYAGTTLVRVSDGTVMIDASSQYAPFIDVYDDVQSWTDFQSIDKLKARIGNLNGIEDDDFAPYGGVSGYGIYIANGYFKGRVVVTGGNVATNEAIEEAVNSGEIYIRGTGLNRNAARVLLLSGDVVYNSSSGRGLRLVTIDRTDLSVIDSILYDVYGVASARQALADKLNSLDDSVIVTLSSYDAIRMSAELQEAIQRCGGSGISLSGRVPYVLIGIPGIGKNNGLEVFTSDDQEAPYAEISTKIVNGIPMGIKTYGYVLDASLSDVENIARDYADSVVSLAIQHTDDTTQAIYNQAVEYADNAAASAISQAVAQADMNASYMAEEAKEDAVEEATTIAQSYINDSLSWFDQQMANLETSLNYILDDALANGTTIIENGHIKTNFLDSDIIRSTIISTEFIEGQAFAFRQGFVGGFAIRDFGITSTYANTHLIISNSETSFYHSGARRGITIFADDVTLPTNAPATKIVQMGMLPAKNSLSAFPTTPNYGFRILQKKGSSYVDVFRADKDGVIFGNFNVFEDYLWAYNGDQRIILSARQDPFIGDDIEGVPNYNILEQALYGFHFAQNQAGITNENGICAVDIGRLPDKDSSYSFERQTLGLDPARYGIRILAGSWRYGGTHEVFSVDHNGAKIAGFNFSHERLWSDNISIEEDAIKFYSGGGQYVGALKYDIFISTPVVSLQSQNNKSFINMLDNGVSGTMYVGADYMYVDADYIFMNHARVGQFQLKPYTSSAADSQRAFESAYAEGNMVIRIATNVDVSRLPNQRDGMFLIIVAYGGNRRVSGTFVGSVTLYSGRATMFVRVRGSWYPIDGPSEW